MRPLSDTIARLSRFKHQQIPAANAPNSRLVELRDFGSNPGALRGWLHVPQHRQKDTGLVVVLHGCTQTAAGYDHGSGWSDLADREGFVVLFPEQQRENNPNLCFNWFAPADIARGSGEALSIFQMIEAVRDKLAIDDAHIHVTGLSAGGAMANVMLAAYPEVFVGGAIIAGLPYGTARTIPEAFERMRGHGGPSQAALTALVRSASDHDGPWPSVSIWQGGADATVAPSNARAIAEQWRGIQGVNSAPTDTAMAHGGRRSTWRDADGRVVIEQIDIAGMGHGTPIKASGADACGSPAPFMLDVGISSTVEIARSWGLVGEATDVDAQSQARPARPEPAPTGHPARSLAPLVNRAVFERVVPAEPASTAGVQQVIEDALRKAGLMR